MTKAMVDALVDALIDDMKNFKVFRHAWDYIHNDCPDGSDERAIRQRWIELLEASAEIAALGRLEKLRDALLRCGPVEHTHACDLHNDAVDRHEWDCVCGRAELDDLLPIEAALKEVK